MKYIYSKEKIDAAMKRLRRFRTFKAYISEHFAGGKDTVIEVCGIDDDRKEGWEKIDKVNKILSDLLGEDAYLECHDHCCHYCYIGTDERAEKGSEHDPIRLNGGNLEDYPNKIIYQVQQLWKQLAENKGDEGTCVLGEKLNFSYQGKHYSMIPLDRCQGSLSRESYLKTVESLLESIGCGDLQFDWGIMD